MTYEEAFKTIPRVKTLYGSKNFTRGSYTANQWFSIVEETIEKQIPKRPFEVITSDNVYIRTVCSKCENIFGIDENYNYCPYCGQAIDWNEVTE